MLESSAVLVGFNSRAREGRDPGVLARHLPGRGFNSRAREGRDLHTSLAAALEAVSTRAPARGATCAGLPNRFFILCFNSRAREGRDMSLLNTYAPGTGFNSRAREGRDPDCARIM